MSDDASQPQVMQYQDMGGMYARCGRTRERLDAGFYDIIDVGRGGFAAKPKEPVSDELIDLPGTVADDVFADIEKFLATGERYARFGLTHKRGYLFYGPPGSGKTSLGNMIANRFINRVGGVVFYCGDAGDFYQAVALMRDVEPGRPSMYLIEEADRIVNNTHCLSILDGELSIQHSVFVAMTNYKSQLPPRIKDRPGRFDRVMLVNCPPEPVQVEYLRRLSARSPDDVLGSMAPEHIVRALSGLPISMAHLREAFIAHVLMEVPLEELRKRFEIMSGVRNDDGDLVLEQPVEEESVLSEDELYDSQAFDPND